MIFDVSELLVRSSERQTLEGIFYDGCYGKQNGHQMFDQDLFVLSVYTDLSHWDCVAEAKCSQWDGRYTWVCRWVRIELDSIGSHWNSVCGTVKPETGNAVQEIQYSHLGYPQHEIFVNEEAHARLYPTKHDTLEREKCPPCAVQLNQCNAWLFARISWCCHKRTKHVFHRRSNNFSKNRSSIWVDCKFFKKKSIIDYQWITY